MLIPGRPIADTIIRTVQSEWQNLPSSARAPKLCVLQVGSDDASSIYIRNKIRACHKLGFLAEHLVFSNQTSMSNLVSCIDKLNQDSTVDGILLQLPLPKHLDASKALARIDPWKDVDAITPHHLGLLTHDKPLIYPCTTAATLQILQNLGLDPAGKQVVMVGASTIVGKPTALALLNLQATVTVCHAKTQNLAQTVSQADILITAIGKPDIIQPSWLSPHTVVIDIGINRKDGQIVGDLATDKAESHCHAITPVPGGVGPITVACLLANLFFLYQHHSS
jgi:methylenetetrahydrofolate dehydrogenase (NADP+)/methenyltetrahydrofolate cyclohydrolase